MFIAHTAIAQEVISLYEGVAPGSESWTWNERTYNGLVLDVVSPTLTVYKAEKPNGTGLIICPGGAFHILAMATEGEALARELNQHGITCFILKYRLCHADDLVARVSGMTPQVLDSVTVDLVPLTLQDGMAAVRYVRANAETYGVNPNRIGIEGSSAGGTVALGTAMSANDELSCPNFAVGTYPYLSPHIGNKAPSRPVPLFIATATDDTQVPVEHSLEFYQLWHRADISAEMHLYWQGDHAFVGKQTEKNVDTWVARFVEWLNELYSK